MKNIDYLQSDSRILIFSGVLLFFISLINGFLIHGLAIPRLALSAHLLGLIGASFLFGLGSFWTRLNLSRKLSMLGVIFLIYGFVGGWIIYFSAAAMGAGGMFPMMSGHMKGTSEIENLISLGMLTMALSFFAGVFILVKGLLKKDN